MNTRIATLIAVALLASVVFLMVWGDPDRGELDGVGEDGGPSPRSTPEMTAPPITADRDADREEPAPPLEGGPTGQPRRAEVAELGRWLEGHVLDARDGRPIEGVRVRFVPASPPFTSRKIQAAGVETATVVERGSASTVALGSASLESPSLESPFLESAPSNADGGFRIVSPHDNGTAGPVGFLDVADPFLRPVDSVLVQLGTAGVPTTLSVLPAGSIVGRVQMEDDSPAPSVAVHLRRSRSFAEMSKDPASVRGADARTDGSGAFRFDGVPTDTPLLLEARPDRRPFKSIEVVAAHGVERSFTIELSHGHSIRGQALDLAARPVPGTSVQVRRGEVSLASAKSGELDTNARSATLLEGGTFLIEGLAPGRYDVTARAEGHAPAIRTGVRVGPEDAVLDPPLLLGPGLSIRGRVLDDLGQAVADAEVGFVPPRRMMGFDIASTTHASQAEDLGGSLTRSDAAGAFVSPTLQPGDYDVIGAHHGHSRGSAKSVAAGADGVEITLRRRASIQGVAISLEEGEPITHFQVGVTHAVSLMDPATMIPGPSRDILSENGTFSLSGIEPGTWTLRVHAAGHAPFERVDMVLAAGEQKLGVIALLPPEARIEGQVVDAKTGAPVANAQVSTRHGLDLILPNPMLHALDVTTDRDGRFSMTGLAAGSFQLTAISDDYAPGSSRRITLSEGSVAEGETIRLAPGAVLRGTVYDGDGRPTSGALVQAILLGSLSPSMDTTADDGTYEIRGLAAGRYTINKIGGTFSISSASMMSELTSGLETRTIDLKSGEIATLDFASEQGGVTLAGRVSEAGSPVAQAILSIQPLDTGEYAAGLKITVTDEDGSYEAKGLVPGEWTITLQTGVDMASVSKQSFDIQVPDQPRVQRDFDIDVTGVQGQVLSAELRTPLRNVRVAVTALDKDAKVDAITRAAGSSRVADVFTGADGRYRAGGLPPGQYKVVAGGPGMFGLGGGAQISEPVLVEVHEDELVRGVDFRLDPGAALTGRVVDEDGQPVPGAALFFLPALGHLDPHFGEIVSDESGAYRADGLKPGGYAIAAKCTGFAPTVVHSVRAVRGEVTPRDITLKSGGRIRVVVPGGEVIHPSAVNLFDSSGLDLTQFVSIADLLATMGGMTGAGGFLDLGPIAPGTYTVAVRLGDQVLRQEIHHGMSDETVTLAPND